MPISSAWPADSSPMPCDQPPFGRAASLPSGSSPRTDRRLQMDFERREHGWMQALGEASPRPEGGRKRLSAPSDGARGAGLTDLIPGPPAPSPTRGPHAAVIDAWPGPHGALTDPRQVGAPRPDSRSRHVTVSSGWASGEMADAPALGAGVPQWTCRFESGLAYHIDGDRRAVDLGPTPRVRGRDRVSATRSPAPPPPRVTLHVTSRRAARAAHRAVVSFIRGRYETSVRPTNRQAPVRFHTPGVRDSPSRRKSGRLHTPHVWPCSFHTSPV